MGRNASGPGERRTTPGENTSQPPPCFPSVMCVGMSDQPQLLFLNERLYDNVTARLAQIERLVKDLREQKPTSRAQDSRPRATSEASSNGNSHHQATRPMISPAVDPPPPDPNLTSPSDTSSSGPKLFHSDAMPEATICAGGMYQMQENKSVQRRIIS